MKKLTFILCLSFIFAAAGAAMAESKPIQLSLTPNIAIHPRTTHIEGLTLSVWGENPQTSLALGIVNGSKGDSAGFSGGLLLNYADNYKGVHWAAVNYTKANFLGWQHAFINYTDSSLKGVQTGYVNYAGNLTGIQFGLVNYAEKAKTGVQIGVINLLPQNRWFTGFPDELATGMVFVNWRF